MTSSALTHRRGYLKRPKICKPPPPPPPTIVYTGTCEVIPDQDAVSGGETIPVILYCDHPDYEPPQSIPVLAEVDVGEWDPPNSVTVNEAGQPVDWTSPNEDVTAHFTALYSWPDGTYCLATAQVECSYEGEPEP